MLEVTLLPIGIQSIDDLRAAFDAMRSQKADGLISIAGNLTSVSGTRIAELALNQGLPSCYAFRETVQAGGLVSLGPDRVWMAKQAAGYVDTRCQTRGTANPTTGSLRTAHQFNHGQATRAQSP